MNKPAAELPPSDTTPSLNPTDVVVSIDAAHENASTPPVALRQRTVSGFVWVIISAVSNKFIGFGSQLLLARWLTPDDFGVIMLAQAAATFALLLREAGVTQVLVQRGNQFDQWAGPAFGLITFLCVLAGGLLAALAHPLAHWYGDDRLVPMLYVIAATCPLAGLGNVAVARLEHDLRFRELGLITTVVTIAQYVIWTLLAGPGFRFGPMSFAWSLFVSNIVRLAWLWILCRPQADRFFAFRAWLGLLADSLWVFGVAVFMSIAGQFDRLVLGKITSTHTSGLYFFAVNQTTQITQLLSGTLGNVLFPALSRLNERPERQREVFLESSRLLSFIATPLCVMQAVLAEPYVALFGKQWPDAVPILQILSVGMAFVVCGSPAIALINSQGRFRVFFVAQIVFTLFNVLFVTAAALLWRDHAAIAIAFAVSSYFIIFGPAGVQLAVKNWKLPWVESWHVFTPGVTVAAGGAAAALPALLLMQSSLTQWILAGVIYAAIAASIARLCFADEFNQTASLALSVLRKRRPTSE